ncbi:MAG: DUF4364 family protein [Oscillospiraceae bacterium]|jgi:hypothetical protein
MQQDAFTAGVLPGGLTSNREIKIIICLVLNTIGEPVKHNLMMRALTDENLINYFEAADALTELMNFGHIRLNDDGCYVLTDTGRQIADTLYNDVPYTVKEKILDRAKDLYRKQINTDQHKVEIIEKDDGYLVRGTISDFGNEIFGIEVYAPNKLHAENIKQNFIDKGEEIMKDALSKLVCPPNEEQ